MRTAPVAAALASVAVLTAGRTLLVAPVSAAPVTVSAHSHLSGPFGLNTAVGIYADCSGKTPLTVAVAAIDTCVTDQTYFVGHNIGVFTPVMRLSVGDMVTYTDAVGQRHPMAVTAVRDVPVHTVPTHDPAVIAQMQTCISAEMWRIVDLGTNR